MRRPRHPAAAELAIGVALALVVPANGALASTRPPHRPSAVTRVSEPRHVARVADRGVTVGCEREAVPIPVPEPTLGSKSPADAFQLGYSSYADEAIRPTADGGFLPIKLPVGVARHAVVTISIPRHDRAETSLLYDPSQWLTHTTPGYRVSQGAAVITFEACPDHETYWAGGIVLSKARCVRLDVQLGRRRQRFFAPVGVRRCDR